MARPNRHYRHAYELLRLEGRVMIYLKHERAGVMTPEALREEHDLVEMQESTARREHATDQEITRAHSRAHRAMNDTTGGTHDQR